MTDVKSTDKEFQTFAKIYPHESYEKYPEQFWEFFHSQHPSISRVEMEQLLRETSGKKGE